VALLAGFDLLAIGVAAPAMAGPLHIVPNQFGFVFSAALFGLMLSRPSRGAKKSGLNQNTAAIDNDHGACAETFAHQIKIGLGQDHLLLQLCRRATSARPSQRAHSAQTPACFSTAQFERSLHKPN
jgi:hypothetical protein